MPSTSDPGSTPPRAVDDARAALQARLGLLASIPDAALPPTRLVYRISGGPPSRRLEAALEITAEGDVRHELLDKLDSAEREVIETKVPREDARTLLREVVRSGLLSEPETHYGFLPDSIVGSLTVESGGAAVTHYFLADSRQRRAQGRTLSEPIKRVRPRLEALRKEVVRESRRSMKIPT